MAEYKNPNPQLSRSQHSGSPQVPWELSLWWQSAMSQWRTAWAEIPSAAWKTWLVTLTIGWFIASGVVLLGVWLMQSSWTAVYRAQETKLLQAIVDTRPMAPVSANWMDIPGHPLYLVLIIAVVLFTAIRLGRLFEGASMVAGFLLVTLSVGIGWFLWARNRPDLVLDGAFSPGLHSFPSGHTAQAATVYGLLAYYWIRDAKRWDEKLVAFVLLAGAIVVIALGRLWIAAHWPSDVFVSLLVGAIMVTGLALATKRAKAIVHANEQAAVSATIDAYPEQSALHPSPLTAPINQSIRS